MYRRHGGADMTAPALSAGLVVVRFTAAEPRYLLLRAYRYWDCPKGRVEAGEDPLEAACRETREETGLRDLQLLWGRIHCETPPYRGGKIARYYLARSDRGEPRLPISPELGRPEHHEFRWASHTQAQGLLVPRVRAVLDWAHEQVRASSG